MVNFDRHKAYFEREYKLALSSYRMATSEDERWEFRIMMAGLERIAMELFGFDYADSLKALSGV